MKLGDGAQFGIASGAIQVDMKGVRHRKQTMVDDLIAVHRKQYEKSGAELILGDGHFVAPKTLEVKLQDGGSRVLTAERVVVDVGTRAAIPAVPGLAQCKPLTHIEALELDHVPDHLLVLGGGYVGLEFAQAMRRFGSRVTVVDQAPQLASREDSDVGLALVQLFEDEGIEVVLSAQISNVKGRSGLGVQMHIRTADGERAIDASDILVAAGREPNTHGIGLDTAGVELDARGYVRVNERLETTADSVWAVGDCAGSPQFTHVGFDDFRIVRDNWNGGRRTTRDRLIPYCVFTDPELGRAGLTEKEARAKGYQLKIGKAAMSHVSRAHERDETAGLMKLVVDASNDRILGAAILSVGGGETVHMLYALMLADLPYTLLKQAIYIHPTLAEGLFFLIDDVKPVR